MTTPKNILIIETSGRIGSVALARGEELLAVKRFSDKLRHGKEMMPTVAALCRQGEMEPGDLDVMMVSAGPGSFTGLRIAITATKTLAYALDVKVIAVPSSQALALNAVPVIEGQDADAAWIATVIEAGRGDVFGAVFQWNRGDSKAAGDSLVPGLIETAPAARLKPAELLEKAQRPVYVLGEGVAYHSGAFDGDGVVVLDESCHGSVADNVFRCGLRRLEAGCFDDAATLEPLYLRKPEAQEVWERKNAGGH